MQQPRMLVSVAAILVTVLCAQGCEQPGTSSTPPPPATTPQDPPQNAFRSAVPLAVSGGLSFTEIDAGWVHTCGISAGVTYCWGVDTYGSTGGAGDAPAPRPVASGLDFSTVSAGWMHSCGLTAEGVGYCWGGDGDATGFGEVTTPGPTPTMVRGTQRFAALRAGGSFNCALSSDGATWCWGHAGDQTLGFAATAPVMYPTLVSAAPAFRLLDVGRHLACGATTSEVYCWGQMYGPGPVRIGTLALTSLSVGGNHACGIATDHRAYCWGVNSGGELGDGSRSDDWWSPLPHGPVVVAVPQPQYIAAGDEHTCALDGNGLAYCWGWNGERTPDTDTEDGRLGHVGASTCASYVFGGVTNSELCSPQPAVVARDIRFRSITAGGVHTCGLTGDGRAYCWGMRTALGAGG